MVRKRAAMARDQEPIPAQTHTARVVAHGFPWPSGLVNCSDSFEIWRISSFDLGVVYSDVPGAICSS
ncbi:hypothetical protein HAX54_018508 [Datura stramonium]|uniref:Uncharacterized protein n=1 Tax=Datura stramonium TaxID=4076 RepID=A0ABS8S1B1_DATST|nr:hypothetical protein [Datura stramonium]